MRGGALAEHGISGIFAGMSTLAGIEAAADQLQRGDKLRLIERPWGGRKSSPRL